MAHPWDIGDDFSVACGVVAVVAGMAISAKNRTFERGRLLLVNGIALGPLLLILASPAASYVFPSLDLLEIAINETKVTVFWAAAYAASKLIEDLV